MKDNKNAKPIQLDKIDRKIISILQEEGRIRILELADRINLSSTPCAKRVQRLEQSGVISGYEAKINPVSAGMTVSAFLLIQIGSNTREAADRFAYKISKIPSITECLMTTGPLDYIARIYAKSLSDYESIIRDQLGNIEEIVKMETHIILGETVPARNIEF